MDRKTERVSPCPSRDGDTSVTKWKSSGPSGSDEDVSTTTVEGSQEVWRRRIMKGPRRLHASEPTVPEVPTTIDLITGRIPLLSSTGKETFRKVSWILEWFRVSLRSSDDGKLCPLLGLTEGTYFETPTTNFDTQRKQKSSLPKSNKSI